MNSLQSLAVRQVLRHFPEMRNEIPYNIIDRLEYDSAQQIQQRYRENRRRNFGDILRNPSGWDRRKTIAAINYGIKKLIKSELEHVEYEIASGELSDIVEYIEDILPHRIKFEFLTELGPFNPRIYSMIYKSCCNVYDDELLTIKKILNKVRKLFISFLTNDITNINQLYDIAWNVGGALLGY